MPGGNPTDLTLDPGKMMMEKNAPAMNIAIFPRRITTFALFTLRMEKSQ